MWLVKFLTGVLVIYVGIVALVYLLQNRMLFPTQIASANTSPSSNAEALDILELASEEGVLLKGVYVRGEDDGGNEPPLVLGFGGNAWNAQVAAEYLNSLFPRHDIVVFHYRGYSPSTGKPSAAKLRADSLVVFDHLQSQFGPRPVVGVGFSIGSGVASYLAANRELKGLILVSPFDSLKELASQHFPWLPVRWLFRHEMEAGKDLSGLSIPVAVLAAEQDQVVYPQRTEALRQIAENMVLDITIRNADHNDIYGRPEFQAAMIEAMTAVSAADR